MVRRKVRDIYGNWIWEDDEDREDVGEKATSNRTTKDDASNNKSHLSDELSLEWRDYMALFIASLQTILLPLVVFIAIIMALLFIFTILK